jgi:hypothetical protein
MPKYIRNVTTGFVFFLGTLTSQSYFNQKSRLETDKIYNLLNPSNPEKKSQKDFDVHKYKESFLDWIKD